MHVVLRGEHGQRGQRVQLVAGLRTGIGEARGHLVAPGAVQAPPSGLLGERLKGRRHVAHVGRAAEDDPVGAVEDVPDLVGHRVDGDQRDLGALVPCARGDGVGQRGGVAETRVVGDDDVGAAM